jgi:hemerythrin-like metal-binding protein
MPRKKGFQQIEWQESMATGIPAIDKQHRYLVDTLAAANKTLFANNDDTLLNQVVNDLLGYAITHFETEEALMQRYSYATTCPEEAATHIAQHRYFSRQVVAILDQLREGQKVSRTEVLSFVNHWLRDHVLGTDQKLGRYLRKKMAHKAQR